MQRSQKTIRVFSIMLCSAHVAFGLWPLFICRLPDDTWLCCVPHTLRLVYDQLTTRGCVVFRTRCFGLWPPDDTWLCCVPHTLRLHAERCLPGYTWYRSCCSLQLVGMTYSWRHEPWALVSQGSGVLPLLKTFRLTLVLRLWLIALVLI